LPAGVRSSMAPPDTACRSRSSMATGFRFATP
jgi:hypothetical protein